MATEKRSISFEADLLAEAEGLAGGNLSALVNAALTREVKLARMGRMLADDDAEFGPVPDEVRAEVAAEWPA